MKKLAAVLACCLLSGCAAKVISSSARSVVVTGPDNGVAQAQALADAECAKHRRYARLLERPHRLSDQFVYDCVN